MRDEGVMDRYDREGYLSSIDVLTADEAAAARASFDAHAPRLKGRFGDRYKHKTHLMLRWVDGLVNHPRVLDAVEEILGPNILCWTSNLFVKRAGDPAYVSWHQDARYWNLDPPEVLTAWIALSPSTKASGCLRIIPGSHHAEVPAHVDAFDKDNQLTRGQTLEEVDEDAAVDLELAPGQMSLHHINLVHGSEPNRSDAPRIGLAIRYTSTRVAPVGRRESALLVRGEDTHGHFLPETRPTADFSLGGRLAHNRALRRQVGNNYRVHGPTAWGKRMRLGILRGASRAVLDALYLLLKLRSAFRGEGKAARA